ncbi:FecR family protein [Arcticibacter tournemirensis]
MDTQKARELLEKYKQGTLSEEEKSILDSWYIRLSQNELSDVGEEEINDRLASLWQGLPVNRQIKRRAIGLRIISISSAAIVLIALGISFYHSPEVKKKQEHKIVKDIPPGGNKAILVLSDGHEISLNDAQDGDLAQQSGVTVTKVADGKLSYAGNEASQGTEGKANLYNTIYTPPGGQFEVTLPDGTIVWLNAASSIKYPVQFSGKGRRVELSGEAYFEVSRKKNTPFIVESPHQRIEVLGTHFNVNSYPNEPFVKTTLLEGAVKVVPVVSNPSGEGTIIKPGEQTLLTGSRLVVEKADIEKETAWKNGDFIFDNEDFNTILRQICRWYDVELTNPGNYRDLHLSGRVSRSRKISAVLEALEVTAKVKFKLEGRRITIIY